MEKKPETLLRISGDGTFGNTHIYTESGEDVRGVTGIKIKFSQRRVLPLVTLTIQRAKFDLVLKQFDLKKENLLVYHWKHIKFQFAEFLYFFQKKRKERRFEKAVKGK